MDAEQVKWLSCIVGMTGGVTFLLGYYLGVVVGRWAERRDMFTRLRESECMWAGEDTDTIDLSPYVTDVRK